MDERAKAFANLAVEAVLLLNVILSNIGINPIPVDKDLLYSVVSGIVLICWSIWVWWKDNNVTEDAIMRHCADELEDEDYEDEEDEVGQEE